jgi:hypothetical protein
MAEQKKYGFKDLRTAAELALAPGKPLSRSLPAISGLKFDGKLGAVASAATLSAAAFSSIKASLDAKKSLATLQTSITSSLQGFNTQQAALLSGKTSLSDVAVFGLSSVAAVQAGGFFSSVDLVQISSIAAGTNLAGSAAAIALLSARRKNLANMVSRISVAVAGFQIGTALIKENYKRTPNPQPEEIDAPSTPRMAQGDEAAKADPVLKDKRKFTVKGVVAAAGKPTFWARLLSTTTDPLKGYRVQPGYNAALNMVFADRKQQRGTNEPSTPYAAQFPYNKVIQTDSGHIIEYDDTPGAERVHIFHRSGSFIEMHPNGKVVYKSMNDGWLVSMADQHIKVKGTCNISVDGDTRIYSKGEVHVQGEKDINIRTEKDFNVYAKNINMRAKKTFKADGTKIDLRYATLPGTPVFTTNGLAVRLNRAAMKEDYPEQYATIEAAELKHQGEVAKLRAKTVATLVPNIKSASASIYLGTGIATGAAIAAQALTALSMFNLLQAGPFPLFGVGGSSDAESGGEVAAVTPQAPPEFAEPVLPPEILPLDNPLGNPSVYIAQTAGAISYRGLMFDTPEEVQDAELYQAHKQTCLRLGDIAAVEPILGGELTQPETGIAAPFTLPLFNYLNRDDYRGKFAYDPSTPLGGTTFTLADLVDSLARPDVTGPDAPV